MNTIDKFNSHIMGSYGRLNVVLDKGEDDKAVDENGKTYIDFGSGIGTNSLGYCNKEWADAVCEQVRSIQHTSNYYYTKVQAEFAERLSEAAGMKNMFLCNSGAEANECAIKIARKYSFDKYGKGRHNIITLVNSFHGRTHIPDMPVRLYTTAFAGISRSSVTPIPIAPAAKPTMSVSALNTREISLLLAPIARSMPISFVRSSTEM